MPWIVLTGVDPFDAFCSLEACLLQVHPVCGEDVAARNADGVEIAIRLDYIHVTHGRSAEGEDGGVRCNHEGHVS
jgi:hypothetical protein